MTANPAPRPFIPVGFAVLTISDTRAAGNDVSGDTLARRIEASGHRLVARAIVRDEVRSIRAAVKGFAARQEVQAIITTGGTGLTGRDVTIEAVKPLFDKEMDGFSAMFHQVSFGKIGMTTMQSRVSAGLINCTYVFCLPGSPGACKDGWDEILVKQFDNRTLPSNFVDIMPRLDEHRRRNPSQTRRAKGKRTTS
ncbi:MAG TPA: molybdenum cofactor biosynthesis protein B [Aestuariivirga sp.]|nr:molybdenum cofactor biosynthesis protein B [Aestuariivirga sp.]